MPGDKEFTEFTYNEVRRDVRGLGTSLHGLGLKGAHIGIIGANCYEWAESYWAVTGGTGVVVPLDKELSFHLTSVLSKSRRMPSTPNLLRLDRLICVTEVTLKLGANISFNITCRL